MPDYIYHGTGAGAVEDILESGLKPRTATDKSNWGESEVPSIENHVYLTTLYAGYFAMAATDSDEPWAIVEVDMNRLDSEDLYPDEDFIEQADTMGIDSLVPSGSLIERTRYARENIESYQAYWKDSLELLGSVSHRGVVPPRAISRISVVTDPGPLALQIDPTISIQNASVAGSRYEMFTRLMMGEEVTPEEYAQAQIPGGEDMDVPDGLVDQFKGQANKLLDAVKVEIHENPSY